MNAPATPTAPTGVVYLVHFTQSYRHARHYTGWTADLESRLAEQQPDAAHDCLRSSPRPASDARSPEPGKAHASANANSSVTAAPRADARSAAPTKDGHDDRIPRDRHRRGTA